MKKIFFLAAIFILAFTSCKKDAQDKIELRRNKSAMEVHEYVKSEKKLREKSLDDFIDSLSLPEKVSQLFIINIDGNKTFRPLDSFDGKPYVPGGYLFFAFNLAETPDEMKSFADDIKNYCDKNNIIPPFLAIDEEGGYVQRLRKLAGKLPSAEDVANTYSVEDAYNLYSAHAKKMVEMGFHVNLAPVVEILSDYNRDFLDGRSFGDGQKTNDYSIAAVNAYQNNGIACVIKHFPGNTNTDPHTGLPEILMTGEEMEIALRPFASVVQHEPIGVLMSHAKTQLSPEPSCFSKEWVTEILHDEFGFDGIVFSDDIFMGALSNNGYPPDVAAVKAMEAGVDCIMISGKRFLTPAKVLIEKAENDEAFAKRIDEACKKVLRYKVEKGILRIEN